MPLEMVDLAAHQAVAQATARQGIVLLQNRAGGGVVELPLSAAKYKTLAMIGPVCARTRAAGAGRLSDLPCASRLSFS